MSLLDVVKPIVPVASVAPARSHRLSDRPPARVHRIAAPEEDQDLRPSDAAPPRPAAFPYVEREVPSNPPMEGEAMPRGVYDRSKAKKRAKKNAGGEGGAQPDKPRKTHKARPEASPMKRAARAARTGGNARFAVYSDGTVLVEAPGCRGELSAEDAALLVEFIGRLKAK